MTAEPSDEGSTGAAGTVRGSASLLAQAAPVQLAAELVPLIAIAELPDEGYVRDGGSRPFVRLWASDHSHYYCKGPSLIQHHPFIGLNEYVGGRIARLAGVPVRPVELISWNGALFAGYELLPNDRLMTGQLTPEKFSRLVNAPEVAFQVIPFDIWLLNEDRHDGNWLGAVLADGAGAYMANDHDLCLLSQGRVPADMPNMVLADPVDYVRSEVLRAAVTDRERLDRSIASIERIDDAAIATVVGQVPGAWIDAAGKDHLLRFLIQRRNELRRLIADAEVRLFPNLL